MKYLISYSGNTSRRPAEQRTEMTSQQVHLRSPQATGPFRQRSTASCSRRLWAFILRSLDGPLPTCS